MEVSGNDPQLMCSGRGWDDLYGLFLLLENKFLGIFVESATS